MKNLILLSLLLVFNLSFSQDSLVDVFDSNRNIIKLRVNQKEFEKIKKETTSDTLYTQRKHGKYWNNIKECMHVRTAYYPSILEYKLI